MIKAERLMKGNDRVRNIERREVKKEKERKRKN